MQSSKGDETFHHEPLVHVPCVAHDSPRLVLVIVGGENATAQEVLRSKSVTSGVMVELVQVIGDACRSYM